MTKIFAMRYLIIKPQFVEGRCVQNKISIHIKVSRYYYIFVKCNINRAEIFASNCSKDSSCREVKLLSRNIVVRKTCLLFISNKFEQILNDCLSFLFHSPALKKRGLYWIYLVLPSFCDFVILSFCRSVIQSFRNL